MMYQSFPFLTLGEATNLVQERIWQHLPPLDRAEGLRENYKRHMYRLLVLDRYCSDKEKFGINYLLSQYRCRSRGWMV